MTEKLNLPNQDIQKLKLEYYKTYGLTVIGLQKLHNIDPLEFNRAVDEQLPMHQFISESDQLTQFFDKFDRTKIKLWLFTNAHISHGLRVAKLLGVSHFFEGITHCDYAGNVALCKPSQEMLHKAEIDSGVTEQTPCCYVDDNINNCTAASERGWTVLCIRNGPNQISDGRKIESAFPTISSLSEIHELFPQFTK